jgi:ubiquinone/menaquinone biosynthesis C-methylase UbiE
MAASSGDLIAYYAARAIEYENVYKRDDPGQQAEQTELADAMKETLAGRNVLEIACGTGYWTQYLAEAANSIVATDVVPAVLEVARQKDFDPDRVKFEIGDAYELSAIEGEFNGALAAFWLSHVSRTRIRGFLAELHARVLPGAMVFMCDNVYVPGLGGVLTEADRDGDTYKRRTLEDGTQHVVLKNYFGRNKLESLFSGGKDVRVHIGKYYWWASYKV